jgi:hypothetical protein
MIARYTLFSVCEKMTYESRDRCVSGLATELYTNILYCTPISNAAKPLYLTVNRRQQF